MRSRFTLNKLTKIVKNAKTQKYNNCTYISTVIDLYFSHLLLLRIF